ncbi:PP2C family protein-serine/threonine phosphatase [Undibacterium sp. TJN25]|uniref:PP2C family protein-serine/threonine phosphatase n=1 Tax=Undibacterium sp. TJN25 TaxID=3413056 RepID=UPI003BF300EC
MSNWKQLSPSLYHQLALGQAYGVTDVGLVRKSNEDNFLVDEELGLVVVGDGMGGHEGGEIASANAILAMRDYIRAFIQSKNDGNAPVAAEHDPDATWSDETMPAVITLFDAVESANALLYSQNLANNNGGGHGMGTTLTGIWQYLDKGLLVVFHVGDSRLYRYRAGELSILTRDQTLYQQAIEEGIVDNLPARNLLLQAIGPTETIKPDVKSHSYQPGDLFLLCTDGLYGNTPHSGIEEIMRRTHPQSLEQSCLDLIELAKEHGSRDNITAVLVICNP